MTIGDRFLYKLLSIIILSLISSLSLGQQRDVINKDNIKQTYDRLLIKIDSNEVFKDFHFLNGSDDNFKSITSWQTMLNLLNIIERINYPDDLNGFSELSFILLHNSLGMTDDWFISIKNNEEKCYVYHFEGYIGVEDINPFALTNTDYFYNLGLNLYRPDECKNMNKDYILIGKIVNNKFVNYYPSQRYHRSDIEIFIDLKRALSE